MAMLETPASHYPTLAPFPIADVETVLSALEVVDDPELAAAAGRLRLALVAAQTAQRSAAGTHPDLGLDTVAVDVANVTALPVPVHHAGRAAATETGAARSLELKVGGLRVRALAALVAAADDGLTDLELEAELGLKRPTGGNRRGELVKLGLVRRARLRLTRTYPGHRVPSAVWVAVADRAIPALEALGYDVTDLDPLDIDGDYRRIVTPPLNADAS